MTHPSHGHSHKSSQLSPEENDLENVSIINTPSQREAFSITPSLSWKYKFVLASGLVKTSELVVYRKVLHMYFFPLHHIFDVMVFDLNVFQFIVKHNDSRELHIALVITMDNDGIHLMTK
jgi:hypothetical protein